MRNHIALRTLLPGLVMLIIGVVAGVVLLLEKNGSQAILGTGTSMRTSVVLGILLMTPGAAFILRSLPLAVPQAADPAGPRQPADPILWAFIALAMTALLYFAYMCFGMTPTLPVNQVLKSVVSLDISHILGDYFHEGEIVGAIGFFATEGPRDFPMLIHGAGRNLLPALIVSQVGTPETMIVEMRFITSAGNFLGAFLASLICMAVTLVIVTRQQVIPLRRAVALIYAALGALLAGTLIATMGRITNRDVILFAVILTSVVLIWSVASGRHKTARRLAIVLGALTLLSPLHTYLGSLQSAMVALTATVITLVIAPGHRLALLIRGIGGAVLCFGVVWLLGGYWLYHDAVTATLYWSENAGPIWGRDAPRSVLVGALICMGVGGFLCGLAVVGQAAGMGDKAVRGLCVLLSAVIAAASFSYANLSDFNHFGFGLYIMMPVVAAVITVLFLFLHRINAQLGLVLALVLTLFGSARLFTIEGNGIHRAIAQLDTADTEIFKPEVYEFQTRFERELADQECLLIMSNDGALAYPSRLPLCGETFNPIHLNPEGDLALADWLENNPQNLVVDGVPGHGGIGGPQMRQRLPHTYEVIDRLYPNVVRIWPWDVRLP